MKGISTGSPHNASPHVLHYFSPNVLKKHSLDKLYKLVTTVIRLIPFHNVNRNMRMQLLCFETL